MAAAKNPGGNAGKGRPVGVPNKITRDLKQMILGALSDAGGQKYLTKQAKENPGPFMTLLGKVLPTQIGGDPNGVPITLSIAQQREAARQEIAEAFAERPLSERDEDDGETV